MVNPLDHPLFQRVSHWINLINFFVLGVTGWFIHAPFPGMPMSLIRNQACSGLGVDDVARAGFVNGAIRRSAFPDGSHAASNA